MKTDAGQLLSAAQLHLVWNQQRVAAGTTRRALCDASSGRFPVRVLHAMSRPQVEMSSWRTRMGAGPRKDERRAGGARAAVHARRGDYGVVPRAAAFHQHGRHPIIPSHSPFELGGGNEWWMMEAGSEEDRVKFINRGPRVLSS